VGDDLGAWRARADEDQQVSQKDNDQTSDDVTRETTPALRGDLLGGLDDSVAAAAEAGCIRALVSRARGDRAGRVSAVPGSVGQTSPKRGLCAP